MRPTKNTVLFIGGRKNPHERLAELRSALSLGLDIVLIDRKVPSYVKDLVLHSVEADLDDYLSVHRVATDLNKSYQFQGVVVWSETDVPLKNSISRTLGLPSMSEEAVANSRNKASMRRSLKAYQHLMPAFHEVKSLEEARLAASDIGFPVIIKPASGSGSKGIFKVDNEAELIGAVETLKNITTRDFDSVFQAFGGAWIVEEYVDGPEYSVEGYVYDNVVTVIGLTDYKSDPLTFVESSHIFPSIAPQTVQDEIERCAASIVSAMGINNTVFHLECKYTANGFKLIECAARPAGGYISTHLADIGSGYSHLKNYVKICCGLKPAPITPTNLFVGIHYIYASGPGTYTGISNVELTLCDPLIQNFYLHFKPGTTISLPPEDYSTQRVGAILGLSENYEQLDQALTQHASEIKVDMK